MVGLHRGLGARVGREARRLLAEVAPVRRPGGANRLAKGFGSEMAIALLDRHRIGVDDEIARFVPPRPRERIGGCGRIGQHRGAVEILSPRFAGGLKDDDPVGQTVGGDHIGHGVLTWGARGASPRRGLPYLTIAIYVFVFRTIIVGYSEGTQRRQSLDIAAKTTQTPASPFRACASETGVFARPRDRRSKFRPPKIASLPGAASNARKLGAGVSIMVFSSITFLFYFLPVFLAFYFLTPTIKGKNIVTLVFSLVFYAWGEPRFILVVLFSIVFNFFAALIIDNREGATRRIALAVAVAGNLLVLALFKYANFVTGNLAAVLGTF